MDTNSKQKILLFIALLLVLDIFVWYEIFSAGPAKSSQIYFLNVGQGDAELVVLPGDVKILIDGGPNNAVIGELDSILPATDRYVDLVILSHPQADHYTGLIDVLKRYKVGAFVSDGKSSVVPSYQDLISTLKRSNVQTISLAEGDKILYGDNKFDILSPNQELLASTNPNDWVLVSKLESQGAKALFTGDISSEIENIIMASHSVSADILKVAHHGSKFSSSAGFLSAAKPKVSVIEVGKNSYGHPTPQALARLADIGSQIFRTDKNGTVKLELADAKINIFKER